MDAEKQQRGKMKDDANKVIDRIAGLCKNSYDEGYKEGYKQGFELGAMAGLKEN